MKLTALYRAVTRLAANEQSKCFDRPAEFEMWGKHLRDLNDECPLPEPGTALDPSTPPPVPPGGDDGGNG